MNRPVKPGHDGGAPRGGGAADPMIDFHSIPGHLFRRCRNRSTAMFMDACRPYDHLHEFPPVAEATKELQAKTRAKWKDLF